MTAWRTRATSGGRAANLLLSLASILAFLVLCETVVFRWILEPSEVPRNVYVDGLIRLEPNRTGVFRLRDEYAARYRINAQGWNSGQGDYTLARTADRARVAIIGDSFVEALQVPSTDSLAEQLQRRLEPAAAEVYRFGISGAPLSHYLFMLEQEVVNYTPDLVVLVLVHNDFDESFRFKAGRYVSSFMKLDLADGRVIGERPPDPYRPSIWDLLRTTATMRYLYYRQRITLDRLSELLLGSDRRLEANIDVQTVQAALQEIRTATDYLFERLAAIAADRGIRLLLLMDGNRRALYRPAVAEPGVALTLNELARDLAAKHRIPFIDLQPRFAAAWRQAGERFDFPSDNHWNRRGHAVAAGAIEDFLRADARLAARLR